MAAAFNFGNNFSLFPAGGTLFPRSFFAFATPPAVFFCDITGAATLGCAPCKDGEGVSNEDETAGDEGVWLEVFQNLRISNCLY